MPFVISKDPIEGDFDSDTESKFTIGGEVTPEGSPIYDADDILTKAGWRYRKKTTDTDMVKGAAEAVKGLWNGFAKIPELVRSKGLLGAANNIPEGLLAAGEGWGDLYNAAASKAYSIGMSEEQDLDRQYDNYRELAERSVEQVKRSRSRVGDFFRAIGAPEHAATMDESIDQDVANSLSMVLDPTNLIGGGSLKALFAAGKGAKVAVAGEKVAVAGEKALQAVEKVSAEVAETTAKVVPPIRDGPPTFNWVETPGAAATSAVGKGAENVGKFGTSVGEKLADWQKANPLAAPIASAALAGYGSDWDPLAIIGGAVAPSAIKAGATKLKLAGEAAQVAAVASREGIDVAAKSGIAGEKVSAIAKRLDTPAVNFLLSQSAQLADAVVRGSVIGGGLGYAVNNDPEQSGFGSGIGAGIVGGGMGRLQSIGIDQAGRVAFHRPDADGKWVRVSESPAALAKDQDLAVSFLASRSLPERTALAGRLNIAELAELARGEAAAKGANRATGSDMEVRFLDSDGMVAAGFDPTVAKVMQGVTETDQKPTLYVNLDVATDPAYTLWHEGMHGFDRLAPDEVGGKQTDAGASLAQTRAELKAFYFGSYDASGKQTSPGKYDGAQFLKLEDQYLSRVGMSEAEMTAHMGQPMSKRVAYIADEMAAEHAGMLGRLSGGDIGKASRYPSTALGRAALGVLARTRIGLESLGIVFDGGGDVVTSGIFKDPTTGKRLELSSDVREKLSAYLRAKDKITTRMSIDFDESPITEVVNARDLAKASTTPETLARWKNSGMFALDDKGEIRMMGGKPVFLTAAERKKVDANRSLAIFTAIKAVPDDGSPGLRSEVIDGVETFKGTKLSKAQVDAVLALPDAVLPPSVKARISELVKLQEVPGGPVFADYNKAITGGRYDSKASISTQIFVPMSLSISAAGNFLVSSFSVVGYERKVAMWKKTKKKFFEPWDGNMDSFHNDVRTYLNNQESGAGNVAVGKEAITKKNAINDFLASVLVGDMNRVSTKSNSDNLIRSFRVDRMQSIERAGGDNMPYDYGKVRANFMPADDEAVMGGQARSQPADELSPEKLASLQSAKQYHGITRNISEAGYALPDGSLLDFSGRHQMQDSYEMRGGSWVPKDGKKDWQAGSRNVDHREIQFDGPQPDATSGGDMMVAYQKLGAMRVDATSSLVDMEVRPTSAQESVIRRIAEQNGGNITVDLQDGNRKSGLFYEGAKPQKVLGDIRRFYSGEDLKSGARFQPADTDYLAAVKAGDMKVVQGMVDEAAKAAGYDSPLVFHGGKAKNKFAPRTVGKASGVAKSGFYFSTSKFVAETYAETSKGRVTSAYLNTANLNDHAPGSIATANAERRAIQDGKDGFILRDDRDGGDIADTYVVHDPARIKSADPITRDAQGNVIPLSKRFNTTSEDIRYQPADENANYSKPPSEADAKEALYESKRPFWGIHRGIDEGTPVGVRIDIPAYTKNGVYVQTVHESATPGNVGNRIGYDNAVRLSGPVRFFVKEGSEDIKSGALAIKEGRADKHPIATVEGDYTRDRSTPSDINSWTAVGMNPAKHSYFYDKLTGEPVVGGSESYSVGNTVFVKDPVYGSKSDYRYQPADENAAIRESVMSGQVRFLPQDLHHGTPHDVDQFRTEKIGTGEGAQVYGHGLYFAENRKVAEEYANNVKDQSKINKINRQLSYYAAEMARDEVPGSYRKFRTDAGREAAAKYDQLTAEREAAGNLYTVRVKPPEGAFLDWDKPLSEQSEKVRKALKGLTPEKLGATGVRHMGYEFGVGNVKGVGIFGEPYKLNGRLDPNVNGESIYIMLTMFKAGHQKATKFLADLGIAGIRYLDQGSRVALIPVQVQGGWMWNGKIYPTKEAAIVQGGKGRTSNYVVFNSDDITITHKNGEAVKPAEKRDAMEKFQPAEAR